MPSWFMKPMGSFCKKEGWGRNDTFNLHFSHKLEKKASIAQNWSFLAQSIHH